MALKILGQESPAGNILLVQTGASERAVVSSIVVCNTDTAAYDFVIYACLLGVAGSSSNTIFKGTIPAGESFVAIAGVTLGPLDAVRVYASAGSTGKVTFTAFGDLS